MQTIERITNLNILEHDSLRLDIRQRRNKMSTSLPKTQESTGVECWTLKTSNRLDFDSKDHKYRSS